MPPDGPYTKDDWVRAVNWAAILGWACYVLPMGLAFPSIGKAIGYIVFLGIFGLPVAFGASWLIGAPILRRLMHRTITWRDAGVWGGGIAAVMVALSIALGQFSAWLKRHSGGSFGSGDGTGPIVTDGVTTAYGWQLIAQRSAWFVLAGIVAALLVRAIIGPGRKPGPSAFTS